MAMATPTTTFGPHCFMNHWYDANVFGLFNGYACCTCNMHQAWPTFVSHLWMASGDRGLATVAYAPCTVTARVAEAETVTLREETDYPFREVVRFTIRTPRPVRFPLHLRIPGWCRGATVSVNNANVDMPLQPGTMAVLDRQWEQGDSVVLRLPMQVRFERGHENSLTVLRGPLVYVLRIGERWTETRGVREVRPTSPWNYALLENHTKDLATVSRKFQVIDDGAPLAENPWTLENAPVRIRVFGVKHPLWETYQGGAGPLPWSPSTYPNHGEPKPLWLIPYGCSTLRITAFPTLR